MLKWLANWVEDHGPQLTSVIGVSVIAYVQVWLSLYPQNAGLWLFIWSWMGFLFVSGIILSVAGTLADTSRAQALRPLRERVKRLEGILEKVPGTYYDLCSHELSSVLRKTLGYGDTERISVYRHRGEGKGAFQIIGRYSENRRFAQLGRHLYPDDEGVIGRAWDHGAAVANLPDPEEHPEHYFQVLQSEWNIGKETAESFTMPSRSLVACALYESKGVDRVAIVVVESTRMGTLNEERVVQAINGEDGRRIYVFLEKMQALEPDFEYARREGF